MNVNLPANIEEIESIEGGFNIYRVDYPTLINEIGELRVIAWRTEKGIAPDIFSQRTWLDEYDEIALHWIMLKEKFLMASARISIHPELSEIPWADNTTVYDMSFLKSPVASINRLVVHPDFRGRGLTRYLDRIRIDTAKKMGVKTIIAEPVLIRINSLIDLGFKYVGKLPATIELPGVELGLMYLDIDNNYKI